MDYRTLISHVPLMPALFVMSNCIGYLHADTMTVDFRSQVQPLLTKHCTKCHGGVKQASNLSFVYEEGVRNSGIIEPGNPENSELIARISTDDPDLRMPPAGEHPEALSRSEIALLTQWVREGAAWDRHWAFVKPQQPDFPEVSLASWATRDLDRFVLARLEAKDLAPSPPAAPEEWLRRVALDLTGLPPDLSVLRRFVHNLDAGPTNRLEHYRAEVDRLLASPHFGERWATMWLDLARYADSQGYEADHHRDVWPYRDWVITAFNRDMPFDEFTIKQIAGDLLPNPTLDDMIATAFHRNTQTNVEGGTDDEEYRAAAVVDRVNTTWTVWHAVTFGCTQCHSHPYDPFDHEEYYGFMAFFNNTVDHDLNSDSPSLKLPDPTERHTWEAAFALHEQQRKLRKQLNDAGCEIVNSINDWEPVVPTKVHTSHGQLRFDEKEHVYAASGTLPVGVTYEVTAEARPLQAIKLDIFPESHSPIDWPERGSVVSNVTLDLVLADGNSHRLEIAEVVADHLVGFYDPMESLHENPGGLGGYPKLIRPRWAVLLLASAIEPPNGSSFVLRLHQRDSTTGGQSVHLRRFAISSSAATIWASLADSADRREQWEQVQQLKKARDEWKGIEVPVMRSRGIAAARPTRLFVRGNWQDRDKLVLAGVPEQLHQLPQESPGRLELARWLVHPDNPLTARVLVNRLWAELFGIGMVETLEDFGSTGTPPSHPDLLDYLAIKLQNEHQWHIKPFLRDLVLSATYCQSHQVSPVLLRRDPRNRLLARGPRTRLTAEMVRDQALTVSGLLVPRIGGPSVMPPQPENVWQSVYNNAKWKTATGAGSPSTGRLHLLEADQPLPEFCKF